MEKKASETETTTVVLTPMQRIIILSAAPYMPLPRMPDDRHTRNHIIFECKGLIVYDSCYQTVVCSHDVSLDGGQTITELGAMDIYVILLTLGARIPRHFEDCKERYPDFAEFYDNVLRADITVYAHLTKNNTPVN